MLAIGSGIVYIMMTETDTNGSKMMADIYDKAKKRGASDHKKGHGKEANPYDGGSRSYFAWLQGWVASEQKAK